MERAAYQLIASETSTQLPVNASAMLNWPPDDNFIEKCKASTRIQSSLTEYVWEKGRYPPSAPSSQKPPFEREWKATAAGQTFMRNNPSTGG